MDKVEINRGLSPITAPINFYGKRSVDSLGRQNWN